MEKEAIEVVKRAVERAALGAGLGVARQKGKGSRLLLRPAQLEGLAEPFRAEAHAVLDPGDPRASQDDLFGRERTRQSAAVPTVRAGDDLAGLFFSFVSGISRCVGHFRDRLRAATRSRPVRRSARPIPGRAASS